MQDSELKQLLIETHPVRPGQEERAWAALQARLAQPARSHGLYLPSWRATGIAMAVVFVALAIGGVLGLRPSPLAFVSADSQSPGIYATAFYSKSAEAQVVWLNGMEPASDKPTYLDPTTEVPAPKTAAPTGHPDTL
jgi:anti-sigma-K factor RskA